MKYKMTILIADDNSHLRRALNMRLSAIGYSVIEARDGLDVLRMIGNRTVGAMILDHDMPNGDGRSIARIVRQEHSAPIIFLSGHSRDEFRSIVRTLSDAYYLPKPLDFARLMVLLEQLEVRAAPLNVAR